MISSDCPCADFSAISLDPVGARSIEIVSQGPGPVRGECTAVYDCLCKRCGRRWQVEKMEPDHCPDIFYHWTEISKSE